MNDPAAHMCVLPGQGSTRRQDEGSTSRQQCKLFIVSMTHETLLMHAVQSHKRRATRYAEHLKKTPDMSEETADPRRVSAFLDMQLRLRKSGGAGFTINPNPAKRKRKRNKKKVPLSLHCSLCPD